MDTLAIQVKEKAYAEELELFLAELLAKQFPEKTIQECLLEKLEAMQQFDDGFPAYYTSYLEVSAEGKVKITILQCRATLPV
jgi:hypothetical protein